jgi:hypothetical protein
MFKIEKKLDYKSEVVNSSPLTHWNFVCDPPQTSHLDNAGTEQGDCSIVTVFSSSII